MAIRTRGRLAWPARIRSTDSHAQAIRVESACPAACQPWRSRAMARSARALIQKRRVMSRSSGFSSSVAVTVRGSSAMPQMGQDPARSRTISGCMGQVYSVFVQRRGKFRLERHAAAGAGAGFRLANFGAHGADVSGRGLQSRNCWRSRCAWLRTSRLSGALPIVTSAGFGFRYCSGFDWNFWAHPAQQK